MSDKFEKCRFSFLKQEFCDVYVIFLIGIILVY